MSAPAPLDPAPRPVPWRLIWALAGLQLVVTLGWSTYGYFQPALLEAFGFAHLTGLLSLYLGLSGATLAPLVGGAADRLAARGGSRFPLVLAGALAAGATFIAVALTVQAAPTGAWRYVLLVLVATWIAAMTVLQAPAMSFLPSIALRDHGPLAMVPLVVVSVGPTAMWPLLQRALGDLGGPRAFAVGGVLVLAATALLRRALARAGILQGLPPSAAGVVGAAPGRVGGAALAVAFALGIASAFVTVLASTIVPELMAARVGAAVLDPALLMTVTFGTSTLLAPTLGRLARSVGARPAVIASLAMAAMCGVLAPLVASPVAAGLLAVTLGGALALHLDAALPWAVQNCPPERGGLGAGLYLGGAFAGSQLAGLAPGLWG